MVPRPFICYGIAITVAIGGLLAHLAELIVQLANSCVCVCVLTRMHKS